MTTDIQNELAADVEAAHRAKFTPDENKLPEVQNFYEIRGLHNRGKMGDCALRTAHKNALAAASKARNALTEWDQLIELFQNEPEVHLDIEVYQGIPKQAYRLHNGKAGEEWQEFYSGTLDTTLEDHKGDVIYADEVAAALLSESGGFYEDLASITEYKNLCAGIKA